jgi:signal transduction histidine kinase
MLSAQLLTAQEVERKRIAGELHDGISQSLSALKFCLENSLGLFERYGIEKGMPVLRGLIPKMQQEIEEVRRISMGLRPSTSTTGIVPTIAWFCREFRGIYHNIQLDTRIDIEEHQVPSRIKAVVYRIVQEGLNNVVKHAQADTVCIELHHTTPTLVLRISDNGHGFDLNEITDQAASSRGMGLSSMKERAENSGGSLSIVSSRISGTSIQVSWPTHTAVNLPRDGGTDV